MLQQEIGPEEFRSWIAYASLHGLPQERTETLIAQLAALYANAHRPKGAKPSKVSDFMPQTRGSSSRSTGVNEKALMAMAKAYNRSIGAPEHGTVSR